METQTTLENKGLAFLVLKFIVLFLQYMHTCTHPIGFHRFCTVGYPDQLNILLDIMTITDSLRCVLSGILLCLSQQEIYVYMGIWASSKTGGKHIKT